MKTSLEREAKLAAWPGFALPDLHGVGGLEPQDLAPRRLTAVYYDTADLRLARWGITVRHRRGDAGGDGWTVKLPRTAGTHALERTELWFAGRAGAVPKEVASVVAAYARTSPLVAVSRLRTRRGGVDLVDGQGTPVLQVLDDEVSVFEDRHLANRFREIEVEVLDESGNGLLDRVVAALVEAGARPGEPVPKVIRALGGRACEPPELVPYPLPEGATVADVVRRAVTSAVLALLAHDPGIRVGSDPESVHQARVAARTLRSNLHTFRAALDQAWTVAIREELSWLGAELGAVRDADVLAIRLRDHLAALSTEDAHEAETLIAHVQEQGADARGRLLEALSSSRYLLLLDALVEASRAPRLVGDETLAHDVVASLVSPSWQKLSGAVRDLDENPPDEALHRLRILAKRCRYAIEAVAEVAGKPAGRMAKAVAGLQTVLGDHQDAVVAAEWLRAEAGRGAVSPLIAGQLLMLQRLEADAKRAQWRDAWKKAKDKRLRAWMR